MEGLTFVVANEFFDALPFHRVIDRDGRIEEIYVGHGDGFFEQTGPLSDPLASFLDDYPIFLQEHQELEVTTAAAPPVEAVSRLVGKGCFLVFDYGYHQADITAGRFSSGSMLGYRDRGSARTCSPPSGGRTSPITSTSTTSKPCLKKQDGARRGKSSSTASCTTRGCWRCSAGSAWKKEWR